MQEEPSRKISSVIEQGLEAKLGRMAIHDP